jgi:hypothetical protein
MKKIICALLFLLTVARLNTQEITVQFFKEINCNGIKYVKKIGERDVLYLVKDSTMMYFVIDSLPISITLRDTGKYLIKAIGLNENNNIIHINNNRGNYMDTIIFESIYETIIAKKKSRRLWLCCDEECNGYQVEYYENGRKKMEGIFKKGNPVGNINYYYKDGKKQRTLYYNGKGKYLGQANW